MLVRYFAAAAAATGVEEERVEPAAAWTLGALQNHLVLRFPVSASGHTPPLAELMTRCSFLLNEVSVRDPGTVLRAGDVVDVLPPFAGG